MNKFILPAHLFDRPEDLPAEHPHMVHHRIKDGILNQILYQTGRALMDEGSTFEDAYGDVIQMVLASAKVTLEEQDAFLENAPYLNDISVRLEDYTEVVELRGQKPIFSAVVDQAHYPASSDEFDFDGDDEDFEDEDSECRKNKCCEYRETS